MQLGLTNPSRELHREGDLAMQEGRLEDALRAFLEALALNPLSAPLRFNVATTLRDLKRSEEALVWQRTRVRLHGSMRP